MKRTLFQAAFLWALLCCNLFCAKTSRLALELDELKKVQEQEWSDDMSKALAVFHTKPQQDQDIKDTVKKRDAAPLKRPSGPSLYKRWRKRGR